MTSPRSAWRWPHPLRLSFAFRLKLVKGRFLLEAASTELILLFPGGSTVVFFMSVWSSRRASSRDLYFFTTFSCPQSPGRNCRRAAGDVGMSFKWRQHAGPLRFRRFTQTQADVAHRRPAGRWSDEGTRTRAHAEGVLVIRKPCLFSAGCRSTPSNLLRRHYSNNLRRRIHFTVKRPLKLETLCNALLGWNLYLKRTTNNVRKRNNK